MQIVDHRVDIGFTGTVLEKKHCKYIPFYKDELVIITPNTPKYQELAQGNKEDISWIKSEISTKEKYSVEARKLLQALLYICRKCNTTCVRLYQSQNNKLNRSSLCKLVKIDRKHLDSILDMLRTLGIIEMETDDTGHLCVKLVKRTETCVKTIKENVEYQHLYAVANDKFREKTTKNVDKNRA